MVVQDFNLKIEMHHQMKDESHQSSIFNFFVFKYDELNPLEYLVPVLDWKIRNLFKDKEGSPSFDDILYQGLDFPYF